MQNQQVQQIVDSLKKANNVMVTVRNGPSVDELTAAVGLTLLLNRMNKHATTVFSGQIPSTIEFLQPEMAIETNTDSLRDFIISLDKNKADKLRYKVEDNFVKIFITPYKTSISEKDLEYTQGDFNVDVVVALGVVQKEDFDQAIISHGRILHDATIIGVTKGEVTSLIGTVNWHDPLASSVSEMITGIVEMLGPDLIDGQIATSLMTGMVAETDRFRNKLTTPRVLSLSSMLMTSGANQQLIAERLEEPPLSQPEPLVSPSPLSADSSDHQSADGLLEVNHAEDEIQKIVIDEDGNMQKTTSPKNDTYDQTSEDSLDDRQVTDHQMDNAVDNTQNEMAKTAEPVLTGQDYIDNPPVAMGDAATPPPVEDPPLSTSLYQKMKAQNQQANQLNQQEEAEAVQEVGVPKTPVNNVNQQTLEHRHKVIQPIPQPGEDAQQPNQSSGVQPQPHQPANDVSASSVVNIDEYSGSVLPPNQNKESPAEEIANNARHLTLEQIEKENSAHKKTEAPKLKQSSNKQEDNLAPPPAPEENNTNAPPPEVINPSAAPAVPPPVTMPSSNNKPQFFEADGSKSNPFLNPS